MVAHSGQICQIEVLKLQCLRDSINSCHCPLTEGNSKRIAPVSSPAGLCGVSPPPHGFSANAEEHQDIYVFGLFQLSALEVRPR